MTQRNPLLVLVGADYVGPFPPAVKSHLAFRSPVASTPGLYAFCTITAFLHESCASSLTPVCQDCTSRSRFGMQGSKPLHCKDHRQPGLFPWPCDSQILSWIGSPLTILQSSIIFVNGNTRYAFSAFHFQGLSLHCTHTHVHFDGAGDRDVNPGRRAPRSNRTPVMLPSSPLVVVPPLSTGHPTRRRNQPLPPSMRLSRLRRHPNVRRGREETGQVRTQVSCDDREQEKSRSTRLRWYVSIWAKRAPSNLLGSVSGTLLDAQHIQVWGEFATTLRLTLFCLDLCGKRASNTRHARSIIPRINSCNYRGTLLLYPICPGAPSTRTPTTSTPTGNGVARETAESAPASSTT